MIKIKLELFFIVIISLIQITQARSIHRPLDPNLPKVIIYSSDNPNLKFTLIDSHIKMFPLFEAYNDQYLTQKHLPLGLISYRNQPNKTIDSQKLSNLLEELFKEIINGKTEFKNFKILKKSDFKFRIKCGLIVLKFKDYPFVVKFFIETPKSLARPYSKGIFPMGMFVMGGTNRHLNGFTRIKNMENIKNKIEQNPAWRNQLSVPRKWFWTPKNKTWIHVEGYNVGMHKHLSAKFPAVYAVIADEIMPIAKQPPSTSKRNLPLCHQLDFAVDPNHNNFIIEQGSNKLVMYDTEHFPTLIGEYYTPIKPCKTYIAWYVHLGRKFLRERIFATKRYQQHRQVPNSIYPLY